ncbi:MmgE/PrpD family protein, partial [Chloroflexota bacterium]
FGGAEDYDLDKLAESLGKPFYLLSPSLDIKRYASCRGTHQAIDAILGLMKEHHFSYQDVADIQCGVHPLTAVANSNPTSPLEAKFSVQYCLSTALLEGQVGLEQFDNEKVNNPEVRKIMEKVNVYLHPDLDESQLVSSMIKVRLAGGQEYTKLVDKERGSLSTLSWEDITTKFVSCASLALPARQINSLIEMIESMEDIENIGGLVDLAT